MRGLDFEIQRDSHSFLFPFFSFFFSLVFSSLFPLGPTKSLPSSGEPDCRSYSRSIFMTCFMRACARAHGGGSRYSFDTKCSFAVPAALPFRSPTRRECDSRHGTLISFNVFFTLNGRGVESQPIDKSNDRVKLMPMTERNTLRWEIRIRKSRSKLWTRRKGMSFR